MDSRFGKSISTSDYDVSVMDDISMHFYPSGGEDRRRILHPHVETSFPGKRCGFSSDENYRNWFGNRFTDSPVLFPKDEDELSEILALVRSRGCRLRVRGAGHSDDAVVMQRSEEDVVTVHLRDFVPPANWNGVIKPNNPAPAMNPFGTATVRISAGASLLEMIALVRPSGWLPFTSYPLASFSVAGAYLNPSTHGQTYGEGRLASQVTGVRALLANGTFREYTMDDPELRDIRGSMGLLCIVTGLEIRLRQDTGLAMRRDSIRNVDRLTDEDIREFLKAKLTLNDGTDFFYYPQEDKLLSFELHLEADPSFRPATASSFYQEKLSAFPDLAWTGGQQSEFVHVLGVVTDVLTRTKTLAVEVGRTGRSQAESDFDANAETVRDGFWVSPDAVAKVEILFYSVKCSMPSNISQPICLDEMMLLFIKTRKFLLERLGVENGDWYPATPLEWRLFEVGEDEMTLEHLEPGTYLGFENLALFADDNLEFSKYHKQLEDMWRSDFPGGGIHHGKQYAYGVHSNDLMAADEGGMWYPPFTNETILDNVYSNDVKQSFVSRMEDFDPDGVFRAGSLLHLLGVALDGTEPFRKVVDLQEELDFGTLPTWLVVVELCLFVVFLVLPMTSVGWFRRGRNKIKVSNKVVYSHGRPTHILTIQEHKTLLEDEHYIFHFQDGMVLSVVAEEEGSNVESNSITRSSPNDDEGVGAESVTGSQSIEEVFHSILIDSRRLPLQPVGFSSSVTKESDLQLESRTTDEQRVAAPPDPPQDLFYIGTDRQENDNDESQNNGIRAQEDILGLEALTKSESDMYSDKLRHREKQQHESFDSSSLLLHAPQGFRLSGLKTGDIDHLLVQSNEEFWLGGCKITALQGPSGSGKTTLFRLLAGYKLSHVTLHAPELKCPKVLFCSQSAHYWPDQMRVRDILLFAFTLHSTGARHSTEIVLAFRLASLLERTFGALSGGQKQLVSVAAVVACMEPAIVLLDEPFASLDENLAEGFVTSLKGITLHSFVLSAHMMKENIASHFDRIIQLSPDVSGKFVINSEISQEGKARMVQSIGSDQAMETSRRFWRRRWREFKALMVLWHGQCSGWPLIEVYLIIASLIAGVVYGAFIRGYLVGAGDLAYLPFNSTARLPSHVSGVVMGLAINTLIVIPLLYGERERGVLHNLVGQGVLHPVSYTLFSFYRCLSLACLQSVCWMVLVPVTNLSLSGLLSVLMNLVVFTFCWGMITAFIGLAMPPISSPIVLIGFYCYAIFFSGVIFPWPTIYQALQFFHYLNPIFYTTAACSSIILRYLETGCLHGWSLMLPDDLRELTAGGLFDTISEGLCASGAVIFDALGFPEIPSFQAQLFCIGIAFVFMVSIFLWLKNSRGLPTTEPKRKIKCTNRSKQVALITALILSGVVLAIGFGVWAVQNRDDHGEHEDYGVAGDDSPIANDGDESMIRCNELRLKDIEQFLKLGSFIGDMPDEERMEILGGMMDEMVTRHVLDTGFWIGRDVNLEYFYASKPENNGALRFVDRNVEEESIRWVGTNEVHLNSTDTLEVYVEGGAPVLVNSTSQHEFTFSDDAVCDTTIVRQFYVLPSFIQELSRASVFGESNEAILERCIEMEQVCTAKPYPSIDDCVWFSFALPVGCDDPGIMMGNTTACRSLHLINSNINETVHCPHLTPDSENRCPTDECSKYIWAAYKNASTGMLLTIESVEELFKTERLEVLLRSQELTRLPPSYYGQSPTTEPNSGSDQNCTDDFGELQGNPLLDPLLGLAESVGFNVTTCTDLVSVLTNVGSTQCKTTPTLESFGFDAAVESIVKASCQSSCGSCRSLCIDDYKSLQTNPALQPLLGLAATAGIGVASCVDLVSVLSNVGSNQCRSTSTLETFGYDQAVAVLVQEHCQGSCGTCNTSDGNSSCRDDFENLLQANEPLLGSLLSLLASSTGNEVESCVDLATVLSSLGSTQCSPTTILDTFGYDSGLAQQVQDYCAGACGTC